MGLESSFNFIDDLNSTNPAAGDNISEGDDHIRGIKNAVKGSFTSLGSAAVTKTAAQINDLAEKSSTQTVSGAWTFTSNMLLEKASPALSLRPTDEVTQNTSINYFDENAIPRAVLYRPLGLDRLRLDVRDTLGAVKAALDLTEAGLVQVITGVFSATNASLTSPVINGILTGTAIGRGVLAYSNVIKTVITSTRTVMDFELEDYDTDAIHDNVTNNSRLTVPSGVTKIRLIAKISMAGGAGFYEARTLKNGLSTFAGSSEDGVLATASWTDVHLNLETPVITVVATDYFEVDLWQTTGGNKNTRSGSDQVWFSMEIIK